VGESASLVGYALAYLALLTALGSGPALALTARGRDNALLAPIIGLAGMAAVLTSVADVLPMRVAAWSLVLPAAAISLAAAAWLEWRHGALRARLSRLAAIPVAIALVGLAVAVAPGVIRGTMGPAGVTVYDGLGYIQADKWLQDHAAREALPAGAARYDLADANGRRLSGGNQRIGVSTVNAGAASLFRTDPDQTHVPFLAVLFALLPTGIWVIARALGAGAAGATVGSLFGVSPALLSLVNDSALANLAALVLIPPALLAGAQWSRGGSGRALGLAALLLAGVVAIYPEFLFPALVIGVLGMLSLLAEERARARDRSSLGSPVVRFSILLVAGAAITPIAVARAYSLLSNIGATIGGQPGRYLTGENGGGWAFGTVTLYELSRFGSLSTTLIAAAILLPPALALCILFGLARTTVLRASFVAIPMLVAILMGAVSYKHYENGHCEYCLWKSLTLMLPFIGVGLAVGVDELLKATAGSPWLRTATRVGVAVGALAATASIARSDIYLARAQIETEAIVTPAMRNLGDLSRNVPEAAGLLLEGTDASSAPEWTTPADYYFASLGRKGPRISFAPSGYAGVYLDVPAKPGARFYSPSYQYVLSVFGGVRSGRVAKAREGPYVLYQRAKIDASPVGTGYAFDQAEGARAIPWLQRRFQLWLSTGAHKGPIALELGLVRPSGSGSTLGFSVEGRRVEATSSSGGSRLCVELDADQDPLVVDVEPQFKRPPQPPTRIWATDPVPPPPKLLGLDTIEAEPGTCLDRVPQ
jgi:hypothetical protein